MENILNHIRARKSVRSYEARPLSDHDRAALLSFMESIPNPYGISISFRLLDAAEYGLSSPVVTGEQHYIAAKLARVPHMEEALGYSFEHLVLHAQSLGLGTVWLGGTMSRAPFDRAMELQADEIMPCVSPIGYPAKKPSIRESMMRLGVKADSRRPFESLFFDGSLSHPLSAEASGRLSAPLEMVRLAPSAVNRQPWRVIICGDLVHFYLQHGRSFGGAATGDLQKIDMGIALCHFDLAAQASGLDPEFILCEPGISVDEGMEYIASFRCK